MRHTQQFGLAERRAALWGLRRGLQPPKPRAQPPEPSAQAPEVRRFRELV